MAKRVFRVTYQLKWDDRLGWDDNDSVLRVLASDAERAIVAARKEASKETFETADDDGKNAKTVRVTGFRLIGVESVIAVDVSA